MIGENRAEVVVLSMGPAGALLITAEGGEYFPALDVPIRSAVGAGDSMLAGIVFALAGGETLRNAVLYGIAAGSAALMTPGTELCRREDTERLDAATSGTAATGTLKVIYHSHTKNGAYFSGEDRARAMFMDEPAYPDVTYLVVSDARVPGEAKAFRWDDGARDFVEVALELA